MYRLAACLVICLVLGPSTVASRRAAAAPATEFYDTVDAAEIDQRDCSFSTCRPSLTVQGILTGGSAVITRTYGFSGSLTPTENLHAAQYCHRLALLAMSKPGKFQFGMGPVDFPTSCRLKRIAP